MYKRQIYKQQQSNMVIDGAQEPRYWEGVQVGSKSLQTPPAMPETRC